MRERLRQAPLKYVGWLVAAVAAGAVAIALTWPYLPLPPQLQQPQPQAPASAPEPTLTAVSRAETPQAVELTPGTGGTVEPSPFAGIAAPPPQPPRRTSPVHHTVAEGEVLWQIAEQFDLRPETILWANDIKDADLLLIGQDLLIPPADGVLYTVRPGDQLSDVAGRYGVDFQAVISANLIDDPDAIIAGVDLFLPGGRPLAATSSVDATASAPNDEQEIAASGVAIALPDNIDALLGAGWLATQHATTLYKTAGAGATNLHPLPGGAALERLSGVSAGRIQVRDPGDGHTRQAMTGWVDAVDLDVGRAPVTRQLPQAYPTDTAMDIFHVFAPYRTQLDGAPYAAASRPLKGTPP